MQPKHLLKPRAGEQVYSGLSIVEPTAIQIYVQQWGGWLSPQSTRSNSMTHTEMLVAVADVYNPVLREVEIGGSLGLSGQPG